MNQADTGTPIIIRLQVAALSENFARVRQPNEIDTGSLCWVDHRRGKWAPHPDQADVHYTTAAIPRSVLRQHPQLTRKGQTNE